VGEWFCMRVDQQSAYAGSSVIEVSHFDMQGRFARSLQSRLATLLGTGENQGHVAGV